MRGEGRDMDKNMNMREMEPNARAGKNRCGSSNRGQNQILLLLIPAAGGGAGEDSMVLIT